MCEIIIKNLRFDGVKYNLKSKRFNERQLGRVGNWCSGLGLAYPHFHEDVSVSVSFV